LATSGFIAKSEMAGVGLAAERVVGWRASGGGGKTLPIGNVFLTDGLSACCDWILQKYRAELSFPIDGDEGCV
jgi:hypothetical protein